MITINCGAGSFAIDDVRSYKGFLLSSGKQGDARSYGEWLSAAVRAVGSSMGDESSCTGGAVGERLVRMVADGSYWSTEDGGVVSKEQGGGLACQVRCEQGSFHEKVLSGSCSGSSDSGAQGLSDCVEEGELVGESSVESGLDSQVKVSSQCSNPCGVVKPGVGPKGGVSYGRGRNYLKNQEARDRKKKAGRGVGRSGPEVKEQSDLQKSSESKWQAQNRLAALKAEREIAILEATDLDEEKRKRRAQICAATERNLVSIEKFHSDLRKSGNTSSDDDTRVNTIFSASVGSISPSSSISEADVRKAKKDMEDAIAEKNEAIAREEKCALDMKKLSAALTRMGQNPEAIIGYGSAEVDIDAKTEWTVDSKDRITGDNEAILDIVYPDGYLVIHDDIDYVHPDGKRKVRLVGGERYSVAEPVIDEVDYDAKSHWSLASRNVITDEMAAKLFEKFPNGYKENYDSYSDAVTGKPRGIIRPTALPPRVL